MLRHGSRPGKSGHGFLRCVSGDVCKRGKTLGTQAPHSANANDQIGAGSKNTVQPPVRRAGRGLAPDVMVERGSMIAAPTTLSLLPR